MTEYYTFQQDSAPAHRTRETIALLASETPDFILPSLWPPNSLDLMLSCKRCVQTEDSRRWRVTRAHHWIAGSSRPVYHWLCHQSVTHSTSGVC